MSTSVDNMLRHRLSYVTLAWVLKLICRGHRKWHVLVRATISLELLACQSHATLFGIADCLPHRLVSRSCCYSNSTIDIVTCSGSQLMSVYGANYLSLYKLHSTKARQCISPHCSIVTRHATPHHTLCRSL